MSSLIASRYVDEKDEKKKPEPEDSLRWLIILSIYTDFAKLVRESPSYVSMTKEKIPLFEMD